jgi:hypothetical protein
VQTTLIRFIEELIKMKKIREPIDLAHAIGLLDTARKIALGRKKINDRLKILSPILLVVIPLDR